jgi:hypothetical protein
MNAAAPKSAPAPSALETFIARCEAHARRYAAGEIELLDAVDALQNYATAFGLVDELGQDEAQRIIADAFHKMRDRP